MASNCYDAPTLPLEEIMTMLQSGVLGEMARNILPEQLKDPTHAVMMQLCLSILDRAGIDISTLSHPQLKSSLVLKNPEPYNNTFQCIHVAKLIQHLVPKIGGEFFQLTDLISPKWKRTRKFICVTGNYFRSWDNHLKTFEELSKHLVETSAEIERLTDGNLAAEKEISELQEYIEKNPERKHELEEEINKLSRELEECQKIKTEKTVVKDAAKKKYSSVTSILEQKHTQIATLQAEKETLLGQVVGSPKRFMSEKTMLEKKLKITREIHSEWQGKLRDAERLNNTAKAMDQILLDVIQTAKDNLTIKEKQAATENEIQSQEYEIQNLNLSLVKGSQEISNAKQNIAATKEKISRMALRWQKRSVEINNLMTGYHREHALLESGVKECDSEIRNIEAKQQEMDETKKTLKEEHDRTMDEFNKKRVKLMEAMDHYINTTMTKIQGYRLKAPAQNHQSSEE